MVAFRVSRRTALVAAAGMVAAPNRSDLDGWCATGDITVAPPTRAPDRVFPLYRALARFLRDPDPDRAAALYRLLRAEEIKPARAAYGDGFQQYLLDELAGHTAADAHWATLADSADVAGQVRTGIGRARALLAADDAPAVFLIFSRRFDGRTDGRHIFLGIDRFGADRLRDQVALLTAHEYNHIVRARSASFATLLGGIVAEGLATACSRAADPGRPLADYLLYSAGQMAWFTPARVARLWADVRADPLTSDTERRCAYLDGGAAGPFGAPPRSGYYLGYRLIRSRLRQGASLADLTRMSVAEIWADGRDAF